jgi:hypothetical protein
VRDHLPGRAELLDNGESSGLLDHYPLALQVHVVGPDDQTNRDATNELVLVPRAQNNLLARGIRTFTDQLDDLSLPYNQPSGAKGSWIVPQSRGVLANGRERRTQ